MRTVGLSEDEIAPVPICPMLFLPQHIISPADESAQAWFSPASMSTASKPVGHEVPEADPPSFPYESSPQHSISPPSRIAHAKPAP